MSDEGKPRRVLLVEDHTDSRELLQFALEHVGYVVATATNGVEALGRLQTEPRPDVIVTDLTMPAMDGWALCATLQAHPTFATIPVIVVSALAKAERERVPGDVAFCKPVDLDPLLAAVALLCERRASGA